MSKETATPRSRVEDLPGVSQSQHHITKVDEKFSSFPFLGGDTTVPRSPGTSCQKTLRVVHVLTA